MIGHVNTWSYGEDIKSENNKTEGRELTRPLHNVQIGWYLFLLTEQAETYLEICVLIYHSTYICPSLFGWK